MVGKKTPRVESLYGSLAHYRLIRKVMCATYEVQDGMFELLVTLQAMPHFTKADFQTGVISVGWSRTLMDEMGRKGYFKVIHKHDGRKGDHNKYKISLEWDIRIRNMYKILYGDELIPLYRLQRKEKNFHIDQVIKQSKLYNKLKREKHDLIQQERASTRQGDRQGTHRAYSW